MPPSIDDDYTNSILTQLYSRKATKKAFNLIAADYHKETGEDLCMVVKAAKADIIKDIKEMDVNELGPKLREKMFKLIDYSTWSLYCQRDK